MASYVYTSLLFLRGVALVYIFAFASFFVQAPTAFHEDGLLPISSFVSRVENSPQIQASELSSPFEKFLSFPMVFWFIPVSDWNLDVLCVAGMLLAAAVFILPVPPKPANISISDKDFPFWSSVFRNWCYHLLFLVLYILYLTLVQTGQSFMSFQWDILLLEVGFLSIFVGVNVDELPHTSTLSADESKNGVGLKDAVRNSGSLLPLIAVRWMLFRLMFASGVVKLTASCPKWWDLSALDYHYFTTCLPSPLSWYASQIGPLGLEWFNQLSVLIMFYIEVFSPFFFIAGLFGLRSCLISSAYLQVALQVLIMLTGR